MSFLGLHTALTGIRAGQVGLDTASHNVANASTPGYTRQRVGLSQRTPFASPAGPVGTGVDVDGITRLREGFLDTRVRTTGAGFAANDARASLLQRAEAVLGEPDNGLSGVLSEVWDAFDDLALDPDDRAVRRQVLSTLNALTDRFEAISVGWGQLQDDTVTRVDAGIDEVNSLVSQVARLNTEIASASGTSVPPNALLDERDLALDRLAILAGATFATNAINPEMVDVSIAGATVVEAGTAASLQRAAGTTDVQLASTGEPVALAGELGGIRLFLDSDLDVDAPGSMRAQLDALATELAHMLNVQHEQGRWSDDAGNSWSPGGPLIAIAPGSGPVAERLTVAVTDPRQLAAAADGPPPPGVHDGRNAAALGALRGGAADDGLRSLTVDLAGTVANVTRAADGDEDLFVAATVARQSAHGVSIDEEMVSLVQYQRALEAASRVMTAMDEALDVLINRTGIVGR